MTEAARLLYRILLGFFVAGVVVQFFLAGLGVFGTGAAFGVHATVGTVLGIASAALLLLAWGLTLSGNLTRHRARRATLLFVLMVVQYLLVELFSEAVPALAALHPVNGVLVAGVALSLFLEGHMFVAYERE